MLCGEYTLETESCSAATATILKCKRWQCDECVHMRLSMLRKLAYVGKPTAFLTLTASEEWQRDPDRCARKLKHSWSMIVQAWKRAHPKADIQYLAVFEQTKRGRPHLHILLRGPYISQRWISAKMNKYMNSPIVHIEKVRDTGKAAAYIAKYISKAPVRFDGCKRYWRSLRYAADWMVKIDTAVADKGSWKLLPALIECVASDYETSGWTVTWENEGTFNARAGPLSGPVAVGGWSEYRDWTLYRRFGL